MIVIKKESEIGPVIHAYCRSYDRIQYEYIVSNYYVNSDYIYKKEVYKKLESNLFHYWKAVYFNSKGLCNMFNIADNVAMYNIRHILVERHMYTYELFSTKEEFLLTYPEYFFD